jgi:hypothetical protein
MYKLISSLVQTPRVNHCYAQDADGRNYCEGGRGGNLTIIIRLFSLFDYTSFQSLSIQDTVILQETKLSDVTKLI